MSKEAQIAASGGSIHEYRKATRRMRWWYESLADYMIASPQATQGEIAAHFGRAECTISTIVNTDAFKAYFRQRRDQHADTLDAGVRQRLFKLADKSLDYMIEALDKKRDTVPLEMLQRITDGSLKNLGYGAPPPTAPVNVNVTNQPHTVHVAVSLDDLEAARAALRAHQLQPPPIDVTPNDPDESAALGRRLVSEASEESPERALGRGATSEPPPDPDLLDLA